MSDYRHKNYEILNLIGYGLAKFDLNFVQELGFKTKIAFYKSLVSKGVADTVGTIKNRQDLFDPFFDNKRKGWWQKGNTYLHRKLFTDSRFLAHNATQFANMVRLCIKDKLKITDEILPDVSPIVKSKLKYLQTTGQEAELYFMQNFQEFEVHYLYRQIKWQRVDRKSLKKSAHGKCAGFPQRAEFPNPAWRFCRPDNHGLQPCGRQVQHTPASRFDRSLHGNDSI